MGSPNKFLLPLVLLTLLPYLAMGANVVIFPVLTKSQLLSASRLADILYEDGHKVTIIIPENDLPDIKPSSHFDIVSYPTALERDEEQRIRKEALKMTPMNIIKGTMPKGMPAILASRCRGVLLNDEFLTRLDALKPDIAILHVGMTCVAAHLSRLNIPYLDFCSVPLMPFMCGTAHRIPANPSYVPDGFFSDDRMPFFTRVGNTVASFVMSLTMLPLLFGQAENAIAEYQRKLDLPLENVAELRGKASFLLVHGDLTFETIRPSMPKVVYVGGVQCDEPKPLTGDLAAFVDGSGEAGLIVFSLGGALDTDALPHGFIENFFDIFRDWPQRVVWKLKNVPKHLIEKQPANVMLVNWMPQQDLLGHPKTRLFISHGGIQGTFESICHGKPMLGVGLFGDQIANLRILVRKGMALMVEDYTKMVPAEVDRQIAALLNERKYAIAAKKAQELFRDQPETPAQRLQRAVAYTLRHNGAHHLTSQAALRLHWFQYYLLDVLLFIGAVAFVVISLTCLCLKKCWGCCCSKKSKVE